MQIPENLNANINECIKAVEHLGSTTYINICTGSQYDVPWGAVTWIMASGLAVFVAVLVGFVVFMVVDEVRW